MLEAAAERGQPARRGPLCCRLCAAASFLCGCGALLRTALPDSGVAGGAVPAALDPSGPAPEEQPPRPAEGAAASAAAPLTPTPSLPTQPLPSAPVQAVDLGLGPPAWAAVGPKAGPRPPRYVTAVSCPASRRHDQGSAEAAPGLQVTPLSRSGSWSACRAPCPRLQWKPGIRVAALGDSLIVGRGPHETYGPNKLATNSWRRGLWHALKDKDRPFTYSGIYKENRGGQAPDADFPNAHCALWGSSPDWFAAPTPGGRRKGGSIKMRNPKGGKAALPRLMETRKCARGAPDLVVLHFTNPMADDQKRTALETVIHQFRMRSFFATVLILEDATKHRHYRSAVLDLLRNSTLSERVWFVALPTCYDPEVHTYDGTHPNHLGDAMLAAALSEAVGALSDPLGSSSAGA
eukprot:TRINITY_DN21510_c0_g1_i2.p1 TRINITY_DN21510_c0_g1~~TRINITY_DN21510_c0_g1_i2.p1  ORF type:complete len:406 (+),score=64.30 TRINITY_DN21510_c0_g1_i2:67-1284(+)